ncbi:hypothetical protein AVEN_151165-1 [Araneus ventricosus]|uniref:Uncharacterized protein n=1 Tax=Araneus ventricosus TaxID=182803 RepID=A0A4Y2MS83_ARAVE|nr:hypothetical protein AVEN_151165-1 [Araneus ventricosus]
MDNKNAKDVSQENLVIDETVATCAIENTVPTATPRPINEDTFGKCRDEMIRRRNARNNADEIFQARVNTEELPDTLRKKLLKAAVQVVRQLTELLARRCTQDSRPNDFICFCIQQHKPSSHWHNGSIFHNSGTSSIGHYESTAIQRQNYFRRLIYSGCDHYSAGCWRWQNQHPNDEYLQFWQEVHYKCYTYAVLRPSSTLLHT